MSPPKELMIDAIPMVIPSLTLVNANVKICWVNACDTVLVSQVRCSIHIIVLSFIQNFCFSTIESPVFGSNKSFSKHLSAAPTRKRPLLRDYFGEGLFIYIYECTTFYRYPYLLVGKKKTPTECSEGITLKLPLSFYFVFAIS